MGLNRIIRVSALALAMACAVSFQEAHAQENFRIKIPKRNSQAAKPQATDQQPPQQTDEAEKPANVPVPAMKPSQETSVPAADPGLEQTQDGAFPTLPVSGPKPELHRMEADAPCLDCNRPSAGLDADKAKIENAQQVVQAAAGQSSGKCGFLPTEKQRANCESVLRLALLGQVPRDALDYALKFLKDNSNGLADPSCINTGDAGSPGVPTNSELKKGIKNQCSFAINDTRKQWGRFPNRTKGYFINLCADSSSGVLKSLYFNKGTGGVASGDGGDREGRKTTVLGAFLTGDEVVPFNPFPKRDRRGRPIFPPAYKPLRDAGILKAVRLIGVQESNNDTSDGKPLHTSPYNSSNGCPSVGGENIWLLRELGSKGPSLFLNYGNPAIMQSTTNCKNVPRGNGRPRI